MTGLFWLSRERLDRIKPYFPLSHGVPRSDDLKVISGIVFVIKNGLRDAPREYGPHKTLYNRFIRWSRKRFRPGLCRACRRAWPAAAAHHRFYASQRPSHGREPF
jgi:transposase